MTRQSWNSRRGHRTKSVELWPDIAVSWVVRASSTGFLQNLLIWRDTSAYVKWLRIPQKWPHHGISQLKHLYVTHHPLTSKSLAKNSVVFRVRNSIAPKFCNPLQMFSLSLIDDASTCLLGIKPMLLLQPHLWLLPKHLLCWQWPLRVAGELAILGRKIFLLQRPSWLHWRIPFTAMQWKVRHSCQKCMLLTRFFLLNRRSLNIRVGDSLGLYTAYSLKKFLMKFIWALIY